MLNKIGKTKLCLLALGLAVISFLSFSSRPSGEGHLSTFVTVKINLKKQVYTAGEPLEGNVTLTNRTSAVLPATFEVRLFQDGRQKYLTITEVKTIYPGNTDLSFKSMGVPEIHTSSEAAGKWRMVIKQMNVGEEYAVSAEFEIVPAGKGGVKISEICRQKQFFEL